VALANQKKNSLDMLHGTLWDKIILFALPLAFTSMLEQLFNAADVAVLGRYVGVEAMAAVGNNISFIGFIINLFLGLSLGANVVIAQNLGAGKIESARRAEHTALLLSVLTGVACAIVGEIVAEPAIKLLGTPPEVFDMAELYLRTYLLGLPLVGLYNFIAAVYRSKGDTRMPLAALLVATISNVALNLLFVLGFGMGAEGVALGTVLSFGVAGGILLWHLMRVPGELRFVPRELKLDREHLWEILRIGVPAAIQGGVFSFSNLLVQGAINSLGTAAMAASAAAFTLEINCYAFVNAFSQAATTFVGQNYGAGQMKRCRRVTRVATGLSFLFLALISAVLLYTARAMLTFFNPNPEVVELGMTRIYYVVFPEAISCLMDSLSGALRGYGLSLPPAIITVFTICGVRIFWVYVMFPLNRTFAWLMTCYGLSWALCCVLIAAAYYHFVRRLRPYGVQS